MDYFELMRQDPWELDADHALRPLSENSISFEFGEKMPVPIPNPLEVEIETLKRKITPRHFLSGPGIVVISPLFLKALKAAGVTNYEVFPAVLQFRKTNQTWNNYLAFNEVGLLDAALLEECKYTVLSEGPHRKYPLLGFTEIVLSAKKLKSEPKMFRMVQAPEYLYISQVVYDMLVKMSPPEKWGIACKRIEIK
jgi:hypothetical protein